MSQYIVAVVLETEFGDRLCELAARMPVWIVDTPVNRSAAEQHWAGHPMSTHLDGVTTFTVDLAGTAEAWLVGILADVDLHHGYYSHDPAYSAIEIYGASLTPEVREALAEYGLMAFAERSGGFVATKVPSED